MAKKQRPARDEARYNEYLKSPQWQELRRQVHERAGGICERCKMDVVDHVHHLHYQSIYNESLQDLQGLCKRCHEYVHGISADSGLTFSVRDQIVFMMAIRTTMSFLLVRSQSVEHSELRRLFAEIGFYSDTGWIKENNIQPSEKDEFISEHTKYLRGWPESVEPWIQRSAKGLLGKTDKTPCQSASNKSETQYSKFIGYIKGARYTIMLADEVYRKTRSWDQVDIVFSLLDRLLTATSGDATIPWYGDFSGFADQYQRWHGVRPRLPIEDMDSLLVDSRYPDPDLAEIGGRE